ncbi:hypothetical protein AB0H87_39715, partial [Asanoa sp. NPDC050611]
YAGEHVPGDPDVSGVGDVLGGPAFGHDGVELLILDEPTAGVDAASQAAFAGALGEFVAGGGTVLLVAHELGPLQPLITRCVVVHHGEIAHEGHVPAPAGHHADPGHDHVHPHAPAEQGMWGA